MNTQCLLTLLSLPGVGRTTVRKLIESTSADPTTPTELHQVFIESNAGRSASLRVTPLILEYAWEKAERQIESAEQLEILTLGFNDPRFPERLRHIPDYPVVVYVRGALHALSSKKTIAVIGTREPSTYGKARAERLAAAFTQCGFVVVSGLAIGCDTLAHRGCLSKGGQTVAVLAHGLDTVYPAQNRALADEILYKGGCLFSEYPPGQRPLRQYFVERDRLQSGLCAGVVVVETDIQGGSMHTARFCVEQGRKLACLKHPPEFADEPKARGNRDLVTKGMAIPLGNRDDLTHYMALLSGDNPATVPNGYSGPGCTAELPFDV